MKKLYYYFVDSGHEIKLVTWPKQEELLRLTIITVIFVLISSFILGVLDLSLSQAYTWFLSMGA